jgi:hypothetical protein
MTKVTIDYDEKRREKRFPISSTVQITIPNTKTPIIGTCCNISGSGLLIQTEKAVPMKSNVLIDISEGKIEFSAEGVIVRCDKNDDGYYIGVKITEQLK